MKTIEIVTIPVSDQQKAKEFYVKLGFHIIMEAPMGNGTKWVQLGLPSQSTSISLSNYHGLMFETDDIEKETGELQAKGIETSEIETTPWGKFARLTDPDGNGLSFHQK
jgi:catechol 2,3-dioxygenase-like lactoylglutathione lyase family enzyme